MLPDVWLPAVLIAGLLVAIKPGVFAGLLQAQGEDKQVAWEVGYRLGQASEFSLLLSYIAVANQLLSNEAATAGLSYAVVTEDVPRRDRPSDRPESDR